LQLQFTFQGERFRPTLKGLDPDKPRDCDYAAHVLGEIKANIARGTFALADYFPELSPASGAAALRSVDRIGEALEGWGASLETDNYSHASKEHYRGAIKALTTGATHLGNVRVMDLSAGHIEAWMDARAHLCRKSLRNYLLPLHVIVNRAQASGAIRANPLKDPDLQKKIRRRRQRQQDDYIDPLSLDEIDAVLVAASDWSRKIRNYLQFAFFTGLRTSEQYALRWQSVDFARGVVSVSAATVKGVERKKTKTAAGRRDVILLPAALEALRDQYELSHSEPADYVFTLAGGGPFRHRKGLSVAWKAVIECAGVRYRNPYQTRHSYASNLLEQGERPEFVAKQLGHSNTAMITRHYGRAIRKAEERYGRHEWRGNFGQQPPAPKAD
jgi:integrase